VKPAYPAHAAPLGLGLARHAWMQGASTCSVHALSPPGAGHWLGTLYGPWGLACVLLLTPQGAELNSWDAAADLAMFHEDCVTMQRTCNKHQHCSAGSSRPCPCSGCVCSPKCTQPRLLRSSHMLSTASCGLFITEHQRTLACQPTVRSEGGREHTALKVCDVCDTGAWLELHEQAAWRAHALCTSSCVGFCEASH